MVGTANPAGLGLVGISLSDRNQVDPKRCTLYQEIYLGMLPHPFLW